MGVELDRRLDDWPEADVADLSRLLNRFVTSLLAEPSSTATSDTATPLSTSTAKESA